MKLKSGRRYKNDLSDMVGIISEHSAKGNPVTLGQIDKAICDLYGSWDSVSADLKAFVVAVINQSDYAALYSQYRELESQNKTMVLEHKRENPRSIQNEADINDFLEKARQKKRLRDEPER